jgi:hypothetical protein
VKCSVCFVNVKYLWHDRYQLGAVRRTVLRFTCCLYWRTASMVLGQPEKEWDFVARVCWIVCHYSHDLPLIEISKHRF